MREYVAKALVFVAFGCAVSPASVLAGVSHDKTVNDSALQIRQRDYWTASSEYTVLDSGRVAIGANPAPRKVLISGYHPVEGFEAEIAAEAVARARNAR